MNADDDAVEGLLEAVRRLHGCEATYVETVPVLETFAGKTVWEGDVAVFDLAEHEKGAPRAYAWSYMTDGDRRRFVAVLHAGPVTSPLEAVRAAIVAEARGGDGGNRTPRGD